MGKIHHSFRDKSLQRIYEAYLNHPPPKSGCSTWQAFWAGYNGLSKQIARIMRGSPRSAAYYAGRDYK